MRVGYLRREYNRLLAKQFKIREDYNDMVVHSFDLKYQLKSNIRAIAKECKRIDTEIEFIMKKFIANYEH